MNFSLLLILFFGILNVAKGNRQHNVCKHGWKYFRGTRHCYLFSRFRKTWPLAEAYCRWRGAYLVKVNNWRENYWLKTNAKRINRYSKGKRYFWLGATDAFHKGHWNWSINFSPVRFSAWSPGQPNNFRRSQHCASMWRHHNYGWNDERCNKRLYYICESPAYGRKACHVA